MEDIYNEIAIIHHTTRNRVERAMRTARKEANKEIKDTFNYDPHKLTNKKVLVLLEQIIRKEEQIWRKN